MSVLSRLRNVSPGGTESVPPILASSIISPLSGWASLIDSDGFFGSFPCKKRELELS